MTVLAALERYLSDPGYTPPRKELGALLATLAELDPHQAQRVERCLASAGIPAMEAVRDALPGASEKLRIQLYSLLGRFANDGRAPGLFELLSQGLADPSERCRRGAASGLGKLGDERAEPLLLSELEHAPLELARVLVEALGKVGTERAQAVLDSLSTSDAELERRLKRARLLLSRRLRRGEASVLCLTRPLPQPHRIRFECRSGLVSWLAEELAAFSPSTLSPTAVEVTRAASLNELLRSRIALHFGLVVSVADGDGPLERRIADALAERLAS